MCFVGYLNCMNECYLLIKLVKGEERVSFVRLFHFEPVWKYIYHYELLLQI